MTQIDFYIIAENSHRDMNQMVCRLCEKALAQKMNVLIYTRSAAQAQQLDDLLWTFKPDSFIPHNNQFDGLEEDDSFSYPVLISTDANTDATTFIGSKKIMSQYNQLLINLTTDTPPFFQQFERIAEMVGNNNEEKEIARSRYRSYRQKGLTLNKYDL